MRRAAVPAALGPARGLLNRVLPEPGDGPSPEQQEAGFYDLRFFGTTAAGDTSVCAEQVANWDELARALDGSETFFACG